MYKAVVERRWELVSSFTVSKRIFKTQQWALLYATWMAFFEEIKLSDTNNRKDYIHCGLFYYAMLEKNADKLYEKYNVNYY